MVQIWPCAYHYSINLWILYDLRPTCSSLHMHGSCVKVLRMPLLKPSLVLHVKPGSHNDQYASSTFMTIKLQLRCLQLCLHRRCRYAFARWSKSTGQCVPYQHQTQQRPSWMIPMIDSQLKRLARRLSFAGLEYEAS